MLLRVVKSHRVFLIAWLGHKINFSTQKTIWTVINCEMKSHREKNLYRSFNKHQRVGEQFVWMRPKNLSTQWNMRMMLLNGDAKGSLRFLWKHCIQRCTFHLHCFRVSMLAKKVPLIFETWYMLCAVCIRTSISSNVDKNFPGPSIYLHKYEIMKSQFRTVILASTENSLKDLHFL